MQVLPAAMKASTGEAGAYVKGSALFSDASNLEDGGLSPQSPSPGKIRDSSHKAHLPLSLEAERFFIRREKELNKEIKRGGCKVLCMQTSTVHSDRDRDSPVCVILL